ncbi:hypothetical protein ACFW04_013655 [Cataglyphis niger]
MAFTRGKGINKSIPLDKSATVFQTEVVAILCYVQELLTNKKRGRRISICSDQATLKALDAPTVTSKLIWNCRCILEELVRDNEIALAADQLVRAGSEAALVRPPAIGILCSLVKGEIEERLDRQAKALLGDSPKEGLVSYIKKVSRLEAVTRVLTGHSTLNYHSHKLGISMRLNCIKCDALEKTSVSPLCDCSAYAFLD